MSFERLLSRRHESNYLSFRLGLRKDSKLIVLLLTVSTGILGSIGS